MFRLTELDGVTIQRGNTNQRRQHLLKPIRIALATKSNFDLIPTNKVAKFETSSIDSESYEQKTEMPRGKIRSRLEKISSVEALHDPARVLIGVPIAVAGALGLRPTGRESGPFAVPVELIAYNFTIIEAFYFLFGVGVLVPFAVVFTLLQGPTGLESGTLAIPVQGISSVHCSIGSPILNTGFDLLAHRVGVVVVVVVCEIPVVHDFVRDHGGNAGNRIVINKFIVDV
jgi:hypothetical protein